MESLESAAANKSETFNFAKNVLYSAKNLKLLVGYENIRRPAFISILVSVVILAVFFVPMDLFTLLYIYIAIYAIDLIIRQALTKKTVISDNDKIQRNQDVFSHLEDIFESSHLSLKVFLDATMSGVDIYSGTKKQAMDDIKLYLKENTKIGQKKCFNGHSPLCFHKIPIKAKVFFAEN